MVCEVQHIRVRQRLRPPAILDGVIVGSVDAREGELRAARRAATPCRAVGTAAACCGEGTVSLPEWNAVGVNPALSPLLARELLRVLNVQIA